MRRFPPHHCHVGGMAGGRAIFPLIHHGSLRSPLCLAPFRGIHHPSPGAHPPPPTPTPPPLDPSESRILTIPNAMTLLRLGLSPLMSVRILSGEYALASGILVVACLLDVGDGWVARRFNQTSKLGSYLDPLADKVLLTCAAVPLGVMGALPLPLVALWGARDVALVAGGLYLRSATRPPGVSFFNMTHSSVPTVEPTGVSKVNTGLQGGLAVAALLGLALEGGWEGVQGAAAAASALPATDFLFSPSGFNTDTFAAADAAAAVVRSALEYSTGFVGGVVNIFSAYFPTHLLYSNPSCFQLACAASTVTTLWSWADYTHKQKVGLDDFQRMVEGKEVVPLYHADTLVKRGERGDKV